METLRFESVSKSWRNTPSLSGISFAVPKGASFGLVSANGAGKTTLLKCLLDFCEPDQVRITLFGMPHRDTAARGRVAYLPERFNPPHYITGRDFLRDMAGPHRTAYDETAAIALLQEIDLDTAALGKPVRAYSKGMNQKLGLAACIRSREDLLILDEPTSGLDPRARILLKRKLKTLCGADTTLFLPPMQWLTCKRFALPSR
jgi:ABC-2 type transport system ATP-binding protein